MKIEKSIKIGKQKQEKAMKIEKSIKIGGKVEKGDENRKTKLEKRRKWKNKNWSDENEKQKKAIKIGKRKLKKGK